MKNLSEIGYAIKVSAPERFIVGIFSFPGYFPKVDIKIVFEHKKDAMIFNKNVVHGKGKVVKVKVTKTEEK